MKVYEAAQIIEEKIPKNLAYAWDNVGLLVGGGDKPVKRVYLTLDTNIKTINEAVSAGADMIISHHPMFFNPIKRIVYGTPEGDAVKMLIENGIAVYAAHTNMDVAPGGINDRLARMLGLENIKVLEKNDICDGAGLGRYGDLPQPQKYSEFVKRVSELLRTPVRYTGDESRMISKAAVGSGACAELVEPAQNNMCDVLITADMKYHQMIDADERGICLIDAGHYPTEVCVIEIFEEILKDSGLEIIKSTNTDIFKFFGA
ncbi:MAG: Nif3-like dinuclear metal center hexameric protein [Firmicutes bacterium]|nr:Nif3-like dinuclear metal center hexameric protein [Bacillota bacterium]